MQSAIIEPHKTGPLIGVVGLISYLARKVGHEYAQLSVAWQKRVKLHVAHSKGVLLRLPSDAFHVARGQSKLLSCDPIDSPSSLLPDHL